MIALLNWRCRFVVCTRQTNTQTAILRSYENTEATETLYEECKVWEACRATSAAPTFFDPITMGPREQTFIDGAILRNNPVDQVHLEKECLWGNREAILVSIGTGCAPGRPFGGNIVKIAERLKEIATDAERKANDFYESHLSMVKHNLLFRFNVLHGLEDVGLEEFKEIRTIADATESYLDNGEIKTKLTSCIDILSASCTEGSVTKP